MDTDKISVLCSKSDRILHNEEFAEKLLKYVIKSEPVKQAEIKTEIAKCL